MFESYCIIHLPNKNRIFVECEILAMIFYCFNVVVIVDIIINEMLTLR